MDIARAPRGKTARNAMIGGGIFLVTIVTVALTRLGPALPSVDGGTLFTDTVRRGDMVREVRGPGSLVPEHIRWITAQASARVERVVAQSGQNVPLHQAVISMEEASVSFQLMVEVRNRLMDSYQEIMRMQI